MTVQQAPYPGPLGQPSKDARSLAMLAHLLCIFAGVFGPLMVLVGTAPRVVVMPTAIWLELSTGDVEVSLVIALVAVTLAGAALAMVHWLVPGRKWT